MQPWWPLVGNLRLRALLMRSHCILIRHWRIVPSPCRCVASGHHSEWISFAMHNKGSNMV
jgi:hypothetical protein